VLGVAGGEVVELGDGVGVGLGVAVVGGEVLGVAGALDWEPLVGLGDGDAVRDGWLPGDDGAELAPRAGPTRLGAWTG
jgi:hypothetical protein